MQILIQLASHVPAYQSVFSNIYVVNFSKLRFHKLKVSQYITHYNHYNIVPLSRKSVFDKTRNKQHQLTSPCECMG